MARYKAAYYVNCESKQRKTRSYETLEEAWKALKKIAENNGLDPSRLGEMPSLKGYVSTTYNPKNGDSTHTEKRDGGKIEVEITWNYITPPPN